MARRLRRPFRFGIALRVNRPALDVVLVGRPQRMQQLVRDDDVVLLRLSGIGKGMHHADQAFLQSQRMRQRDAVLRRVIQHEQLDPAQLRQPFARVPIHPPPQFQAPPHRFQRIVVVRRHRWLLMQFRQQADLHGRRLFHTIARGLAFQKSADVVEIAHLERADHVLRLRRAVAVDRDDGHIQGPAPCAHHGLLQPGQADCGSKNTQQDENADSAKRHGTVNRQEGLPLTTKRRPA